MWRRSVLCLFASEVVGGRLDCAFVVTFLPRRARGHHNKRGARNQIDAYTREGAHCDNARAVPGSQTLVRGPKSAWSTRPRVDMSREDQGVGRPITKVGR